MSKKRSTKPRSDDGQDGARPPVVLGVEFAAALAAEERRRARAGLAKSPMPAPDDDYDPESNDLHLIRPRICPVDTAIAKLTRKFAKADEAQRSAIRESISLDEFYMIVKFSGRAAVFALRERNPEWLTRGLTAIAMIEAERIDWRDIGKYFPTLIYAADRIGANAQQLFDDAMRLAEPRVARLMDGYVEREPVDQIIPTKKGPLPFRWCDEIEVDGTLGIIEWGRDEHWTHELAKAIVEIADLITQDRYYARAVGTNTTLPRAWLESESNPALKRAASTIRACAGLVFRHRAGEHPDPINQMFRLWIAKTANKAAAARLLEASGRKTPRSYSMLGLAEKDLFCFLVAGSDMRGVKASETRASLRRFSPGLTEILRRYAA